MNLLIIGGTGILSTAVVTEAINKGIDVTMINRGYNKKFINPRAELIIGDVRNNPSEIKDKLKNRHFDAIIDFIVWTKEHLELSLSLFSKISDQYVFISSAQAYNTSVKGILNNTCLPICMGSPGYPAPLSVAATLTVPKSVLRFMFRL